MSVWFSGNCSFIAGRRRSSPKVIHVPATSLAYCCLNILIWKCSIRKRTVVFVWAIFTEDFVHSARLLDSQKVGGKFPLLRRSSSISAGCWSLGSRLQGWRGAVEGSVSQDRQSVTLTVRVSASRWECEVANEEKTRKEQHRAWPELTFQADFMLSLKNLEQEHLTGWLTGQFGLTLKREGNGVCCLFFTRKPLAK